MCRFANRCENFYPDEDNPRTCLLLCQRNPLALTIRTMPDRYVETEATERDESKIINVRKELPEPVSYQDRLKQGIKDAHAVREGEAVEHITQDTTIPSLDELDAKANKNPTNLTDLINRATKSSEGFEIDPEVTKAIRESVIEAEDQVVHPLDQIEFELNQKSQIADTPPEPQNPEGATTGNPRGRPPLSEKEKAKRAKDRLKQKAEEEAEKEKEMEERRKKKKKEYEKWKAEQEAESED